MISADNLNELPTPCLLLDRQRLQRNLDAMRRRMDGHGVDLRPHVKTAKSPDVARLACGGKPGPITVSTLREAEAFAKAGFTDVVYAVGISARRFERAAALLSSGVDLTVICDHPAVARDLAAAGARFGVRFPVLIEIDPGAQRAGLPPDAAELPELARQLGAAASIELRGVLGHAGHAYECESVEAIRAVALQERDAVASAATVLLDLGLPCPVVSAGSTPTAVHVTDLSGVTEMRPGVYMFFDLAQLGLGSCSEDDLALSVLTRVIGHSRHAGHLLVDSGGLALSKDTSAAASFADAGYGYVCEAGSGARIPGLRVADVNQEHGMIPLAGGARFDDYPPGTLLRVLPNHACMTAAAHDRYHVVDENRVVGEWARVNGW